MDSFLKEVASDIYTRFGGRIGSLKVLLPSRRGRLFLVDVLTELAQAPMWEPEWLSMDDMMANVAGVKLCDRMRLITELYAVYKRFHPTETFDKFYFWGEILLSDFDQIDKYLIDGDMLFRNVGEIKEIEADIEYLTEEQRRIVMFWSSVGRDDDPQEYKSRFLKIWQSLGDIYREYRERLLELGIAYPGLIHRVAVEKIKRGKSEKDIKNVEPNGDEPLFDCTDENPYIIVGFNALSECEKVLFRELKACGALFYWDYDDYYTNDDVDGVQESGLFLRDNIKEFPQPADAKLTHDNFAKQKSIEVVACSSTALQCKYVAKILDEMQEQLSKEGKRIDKNTAIVLTDESLLLPLLYALPEHVGGGKNEGVNVTMGYPLRQSLAYSFVERLLQLQQRGTQQGFYHVDVVGVLSHPYLEVIIEGDILFEVEREIENRRLIRVPHSLFAAIDESRRGADILRSIFELTDSWSSLSAYLSKILELAISQPARVAPASPTAATDLEGLGAEADQRVEFLTFLANHIVQLHNSIDMCNAELKLEKNPEKNPETGSEKDNEKVELTTDIYTSLLRRHLQPLRIPFEGEPLNGPQILGILETRTLDFENVIILSMNDDNFPGNHSLTPSYIPYNLRFAYGMPTPEYHDGVFAYYFYRLIESAKNVKMLYCSKSDDKSTGEQSRYITQLDFETDFEIVRTEVGVDAGISSSEPMTIAKVGDSIVSKSAVSELAKFKQEAGSEGHRRLSPTALFRYVACPMRFYFASIAGIGNNDSDVSDGVDALIFGNILHEAMETLYTPALGQPSVDATLAAITAEDIERAVDLAIANVFLRRDGDDVAAAGNIADDYSGDLILVKEVVLRYVRSAIDYDMKNGGFEVLIVERKVQEPVQRKVTLTDGSEVTIYGVCDRVDKLSDGTIRIVDYKTGAPHLSFPGVEKVFEGTGVQRQPNIFQTLLYSYIFYEKYREVDRVPPRIQPALYYVRDMHKPEFSPLLVDKMIKGVPLPLDDYGDWHREFEELLIKTLDTLFDVTAEAEPFVQCEDRTETCKYCEFKVICGDIQEEDTTQRA